MGLRCCLAWKLGRPCWGRPEAERHLGKQWTCGGGPMEGYHCEVLLVDSKGWGGGDMKESGRSCDEIPRAFEGGWE